MFIDKSALIAALITELRQLHERAIVAVAGAREAATGADTKAENKYDTRGLEASYLAAGQASQAEELLESIRVVEAFTFPNFDLTDPIRVGALVEVDQNEELRYYLLAPAGGGITLTCEGEETVTVLGPSSPLAKTLLGKSTGNFVENPELIILDVS